MAIAIASKLLPLPEAIIPSRSRLVLVSVSLSGGEIRQRSNSGVGRSADFVEAGGMVRLSRGLSDESRQTESQC